MTERSDLEGEVGRLAAESLAVRTILAQLLARLSALADPDIAAAIRRGLDDAERVLRERRERDALSPADLAAALTVLETMKSEALRAKPSGGFTEEHGAFHAESNDQWPEDDY
jgi:hypothetical protein